MHRFIALILFLAVVTACNSPSKKMESTYLEKYRPQLHFSPEKNWMNDPNGLVYFDGEYHLFYQYNPYGDTWGHMSWGHAVSNDLLHWKQLPIALEEYQDPATGDSTMIFSGTAVIDKNNTAGFGANAMVAIYTSHVHKNNQGVTQHQSLTYSTDKGRSWKRYDKNPILDIQRKDFRDPKVFWYEPQQKWVMALVVPDMFKVQLYSSTNLKEWKLMSEFGHAGDRKRIWECPDLYELPIENENKTKWVLSLSGSHPSGPKFVGMQYFVGDFDGTTFQADDTTARYVDYGKDFYAGIVFNNLNKKIMLGWLNNWTYGNQIPTSPWRGAFSIPRELSLKKSTGKFVLIQQPIESISQLRKQELKTLENITEPIELEVELQKSDGGIMLQSTDGDELMIGYDAISHQLFIDRSKAGLLDFQKDFASIEKAMVASETTVTLQIFIDQSIVEVFANGGEITFGEQFFFKSKSFNIKPFGNATIKNSWLLKSIWK